MGLILVIAFFAYFINASQKLNPDKKVFDMSDDLFLNGVYSVGDEFL